MLNLGTLLFGLGVDMRGLDAAQRRVEAFGRTVQGAQTAANRGFDTSIGALRRQENALLTGLNKLRGLQEQINRTSLAPTIKGDALRQLNQQWELLSKRVTSTAAGLDPTKIDRAVASFNQAASNISATYQNMDRTARTATAAIERQTQAVFRADQAARNLGQRINLSTSPELGLAFSGKRQELTGQLEAAYQRFRDQMSKPVSNEQARQFQREWTAALNDVQRKFRELGGAVPAASALDQWRRGLRGLGDSMLLLHGHLGGLSTRFFALSTIISSNGFKFGAAAAGVVAFAGATNTLIQSAIQSRLVLEKMTNAMTAITGSSAAAGGALQYVREISDRAGLSINSTAQSFSRLTASGKAAGMSQAEINNIFESFAQTSGVLALSVEDTQGVFRALDQIMSKGTVQAEELRGQLGDRLPGAFAIAAVAMGKTTAELNAMMKKGEVLSRDFLPKFTEQVKIAFGIDTSKNVETMQASINRLSNSWLFFGRAVDQSFGITNTYMKLLEGLANLLNNISANMQNVVGVVGALAGALAGLAAVMWGPAILTGIAAGWAALSAAIAGTATTVGILTRAMAVFGVVMASNPVGALIGLLVRLGVVLGGAYLGFKLASGAADNLNSSMSNLGPINAYIEQQRKLGTQVKFTTGLYVQQMKVIAATANMAAQNAASELRSLKGGPGLMEYGMAAGALRRGVVISPDQIRQNQRTQALGRAREAVDNLRKVESTLRGLRGIMDNPELGSGGSGVLAGDKDGKGKKGVDEWANALERAAEMVRKLNDDLRNANFAAEALFGADAPDFKAVDALLEARQMIQGLSEMELKALQQSMGMAGASTEDLTLRIASLIQQTTQAKDAVAEFTRIWDTIKEGQQSIKDANTAIQFLQRGGDPDKMWAVDATNKAYNMIAKLTELGPKGAEAIAAIQRQMALLGFSGNSAADALAKFLMHMESLNKAKAALESVAKAWGDVAKETEKAQILVEAYARGTAVGEAAERLLEIADKVAEFRRQMEAIPGADVEGEVAKYAAHLAALDAVQQKLEETKQRMADFRDVWNNGFRSAFDNLKAWADGSKKFLEAVTDTLMSILDNFASKAIDVLAEGGWNALFGDPTKIAAGILGGRQGGGMATQQAAAARSLNALTLAAQAAATALQRIAGGMGGFGGMLGGGGGGLFDILLQGAGSIFGAAIGGGGSAGPFDTNAVIDGLLLGKGGFGQRSLGASDPTALSSTITKSGRIGQTVHNDFSTQIDARGATQDFVRDIMTEMNKRDQRIRAELPYHIDQRQRENAIRLRGGA